MKSLSFQLNTATAIARPSTTSVSLHKLVDKLMNSFIPLAVANKSFIVNDIEADFELEANEQILAYVVGNLLNNAITCSKSVCIRIEAVKDPKGLQIRVRNNGTFYYSTVAHGFSEVVEAARSIGGNINIYNQRHEGTVVTLSMAA